MVMELTHAALRQATADMRAAASRISTRHSQADTRMSDFLGSGWLGVANDSFVEAWQDWRSSAKDVEEGLTAMAELLEAQHRDFITQDDETQRALDNLSARIIDRLG